MANANERLQYEVDVNLELFEKSMKRLAVDVKKGTKNMVTSFKEVDDEVQKLEKSMNSAGSKVGKNFVMGSNDISKSMKKIMVDSVKAGDHIGTTFNKTTKEVEKFNKSLKGVGTTSKAGFEKAKKVVDKTTTSTKKLNTKTTSLEKTVKRLVGGYLGLQGAKKIIDGIVNVTKKVVSETGELQTAGEKWRILTNDIEGADKILRDLFEFSHKTPFTFKDVNKAATQLFVLTDGALQGTAALEQMADRAAMAKVPMSQLTTWWGRLYSGMQSGKPIGRALTRMQQMGIISGKLRNKLDSLSKDDMMSGKGWEMFIEGSSKAEGMVGKLAQTIEGKMSTLGGVWDAMFAFKDADAQQNFANVIQGFIDILNQNTPVIQGTLKNIFGVMGDFALEWIQIISDGLAWLQPEIKQLRDYQFEALAESHQMQMKFTKEELEAKKKANDELIKEQLATLRELNPFESNNVKSQQISEGNKFAKAFESGNIQEVFKLMDKYEGALEETYGEQIAVLLKTLKQTKAISKAMGFKTTSTGIPGADGFTGGSGSSGTGKKGKIKETKISGEQYVTWGDLAFGEKAKADARNREFGAFNSSSFDTSEDANFWSSFDDNDLFGDKAIQKRLDDQQKALEAQQKFYNDSISIISSSENAILNIHKAWAGESVSEVASGFAGVTGNISQILGTLGQADASGVTGIIAAGFGIVSTIATLFEEDDASSSSDSTGATASVSQRANIVSSGPEKIEISNSFSIVTGYIGDEVGTAEFFDDQIAPLIANSVRSTV